VWCNELVVATILLSTALAGEMDLKGVHRKDEGYPAKVLQLQLS
jgi:hypothetical protein